MRQAASLVKITSGPPVPDEGLVLYSPPEASNEEPRSCINCWMWNEEARTCRLMGPNVRAEKFTYPPTATADGKPVEYWPVCGMWDFGKHNEGPAIYKDSNFDSPDDIGFGYVNAPEVGLERGGTNCGGQNGGDDCDNFIIAGDDKRKADSGFCRVLQHDVPNLSCCSSWQDDDFLTWQRAQKLLEELDKKRVNDSTPNPLLK